MGGTNAVVTIYEVPVDTFTYISVHLYVFFKKTIFVVELTVVTIINTSVKNIIFVNISCVCKEQQFVKMIWCDFEIMLIFPITCPQ